MIIINILCKNIFCGTCTRSSFVSVAKNTRKYYDYYVDANGNIYDNQLSKVQSYKTANGYLVANLLIKGKRTSQYVHRVAAIAWIDNPFKKKTVNHINGIKTDNSIENLEWNTHSENLTHAVKMSLVTNTHFKKKVVDVSSGIVYDDIAKAAKACGYSYSHFAKMLCGARLNITKMSYCG